MSLQTDIENCLASLDSPVLIHLNHTSHRPRSPSVSTKNNAMNSSRPRSNSLRRPYTRSPLGELSGSDYHNVPTRARSSSRASSFTGSMIVRHESRYSMRPSNSFQALPPILSGSSVHFRSNLDSNFQSFMISSGAAPRSRRASRLSENPPALPPLPSLSQPLFPPVAETSEKDLFQIPSLRHPNSPYVPWDSPMRRQIFRPLTPESSESLASRSEASRSGARAPEPVDPLDDDHKAVKVSWGIRKVHRTVKHVAGVAKRMFMRQKFGPPPLAINTHLPNTSLHPPVYPPSPGVASFDSSNTRSLALWLDARRQETLEWDADSRHFMSLEDYERRGSWINFAGVCSVPGCSVHSRLSNAVTTIDLELNVLSCDQKSHAEFEQQEDVDMHRASHDSDETAISEHIVYEKVKDISQIALSYE
ncbi:hypothetical protein GGU10DRAFT_431054 [Lentinula aff. detonsa]|uniref:Uncharacterized protein n=1 Tax=Lentinula aff. detonsa TaxID=2804958 RepID=A0AA38NSC1_9AGAR|nr:hypothetical protein GGU10DRAFT_431054 [Lentinula aff. detonsa]